MSEDSSERVQQLEEPRSYLEILRDVFRDNKPYLVLLCAAWLLLMFVTNLAFLAHVHVSEIAVIAQAEQQAGHPVEERLLNFYVAAVLTGVSGIAALWEFTKLKSRGEST